MLLLIALLVQDDGAKAFAEGRYADAAEFYRKAVETRPTPELHLALGRCRLQLRDWEGAATSFAAALSMKADLGADVHRALGQALVMAGTLDDGLRHLRRARTAAPADGDGLWIARALVQKGAYAAAELEAAQLPESAEAVELLAWLLTRRGRHAEAAELQRELLRREPGASKRWLALGQAEAAAGREGEAIDALEAARRLGKLDAGGLKLLADLCLRAQLYREAADAYAALASPGAEDLVRLGHARLRAGEPLSAREAFEKALAAEPGRKDAALELGRLAGDPAEARKHFKAAGAHAALGELELKAGDPAAAAAAFAEALMDGERSVAVFYYHALALRQAGKDAWPAIRDGLREHPLDERLRSLLKSR